MEDMRYYAQRLEFIIHLFKAHESSLLADNKDEIKRLLEGYKKFEVELSYNPVLAETIETFIL